MLTITSRTEARNGKSVGIICLAGAFDPESDRSLYKQIMQALEAAYDCHGYVLCLEGITGGDAYLLAPKLMAAAYQFWQRTEKTLWVCDVPKGLVAAAEEITQRQFRMELMPDHESALLQATS